MRWFLRRRVNRVLEELNTRLKIRIQPFKLTKREVLIDRLLYDSAGAAGGRGASRARPTCPARSRWRGAQRYAREIVPAFNAYLYFRIGYSIARTVARSLYRVRLGYADEEALAAIGPDSTVVFVINHRSNMDYVLVGYLAAERTALSYAVGEWARIWPLQTLIRAMGAYFVRRNSRDALYRKVLERYVADGDRGGRDAGDLSRGRPLARRHGCGRRSWAPRLHAARASTRPARATSCSCRSASTTTARFEDRSLLLGLDPSADGARSAPARSATALRFVGRNALAARAQPLAPLRLRLRQLRLAGLAAGVCGGAASTSGAYPRRSTPAGSRSWPAS